MDANMPLNDAKIKALKLSSDKKQLKLSDGGGLCLLVTKSGKYWRVNYRFGGKQKTLALGTYPSISLKSARTKHLKAKQDLSRNIDPMAQKKIEKANHANHANLDTFQAIAKTWIMKKKPQWADKTYLHKESELSNHILPWLGALKINTIRAMDILQVCQRIEANGHHEQAHRVKMLCGQIMRYAVAIGKAERDPTPDLKGALTPVKSLHRPCLQNPKQVGELMRAISEHQGTFIVHCALRLSPYIFLRPSELRSLEWQEIDFNERIINIPGEKMKMRQTHIVPLSTQAIEILQEIQSLTGRGRYVFPGARSTNRCMSDGAINATLRRIGYDTKREHCAHGFRGTASTLLHELGYNSDVIERQLAHKEGNAIKAAYNHARHLPERKKMMQEWADYLNKLKSHTLND